MSEPTRTVHADQHVFRDDDFIEFDRPSLVLSIAFPLAMLVAAIMLYFEREIPILSSLSLAGTRRYHTAGALMLVGLATLIHLRTFWDAQREGRWYVMLGYAFGFTCMIGCAAMVVLRFLRMA